MTCPEFEQLIDHLDGRLDRAALESVTAHLAQDCGRCESDRKWYQHVKLVAACDDSLAPPPWVLKRALRLFNASARASIGARVGRVVAALVFDSLKRPALAGVRSGGVEGRQLLYRADDYSLDVQVAAADQMMCAEVTGQILREGELMFESVAGIRLDLIRNGGIILSTMTNDRGEFTIQSIEPGSYDLRVDVNETSITIVGLPVAS